MAQAELLTASKASPSEPAMSWAERKLAEATWRYRVKHWTKSQRREQVLHLLFVRKGLADGTLMSLMSTAGRAVRRRFASTQD